MDAARGWVTCRRWEVTTNLRDAAYRILCESFDMGVDIYGGLDDLAAAGFVVVACPPGSRVVVSRESKPCAPCEGTGRLRNDNLDQAPPSYWPCTSCGGSGVVEATTTYGLERVGWSGGFDFPKGDLWEQVALLEDGA